MPNKRVGWQNYCDLWLTNGKPPTTTEERSARIAHHKNQARKRKGDTAKPQVRLYRCSLNNARQKGMAHTIKPSDIPLPEKCAYLGITLDYRSFRKRGRINGASVDRIDSKLGYVPGNIQVISILANRMKTNATPKQLIRFSINVLRMYGLIKE